MFVALCVVMARLATAIAVQRVTSVPLFDETHLN